MTDAITSRLGLPMLQPGQAQKEMFHNEALALIDMAVQPAVQAIGADVPPATPTPGQAWLIGAAPVGDWAGRAGALACWTDGGWRFLHPWDGMEVWRVDVGMAARFRDGQWSAGILDGTGLRIAGQQVVGPRAGAIAAPGGGTVIDVQARAAIGAVIAALSAHGLIGAA